MASAASSFVFTSNLASITNATRANSVFFNKPSNVGRRSVVRAEEASTSPPAPTAEAGTKEAPKPPSIGPKRGTKDPKTRYPAVVRFSKVNDAGVSTNNYALDEIQEVK